MTCIVGFVDKKNKKVIIGGDSAGVSGFDLTVRKDPKVFKVKDFIIGGTTSFRMLQILRFKFNPPEIDDKELYEYMCTDFIDSVREVFKENGFEKKYSSGDELGGCFLVGYKDRLFMVEDDFQVSETIRGFDAVGCGATYALGSIYSDNDNVDYITSSRNKVKKSLLAAEFFSSGVRSPFVIIET